VLKFGDDAPDFPIGGSSLHEWLRDRSVVVFFFPRAFTPG
jgi:peroxiredoxin